MPRLSDYTPADFGPLLSSIAAKVFVAVAPLRITAWLTKEPAPFKRRREGKEMRLAPGSIWGTDLFDCAWFLFEGTAREGSDPLVLLIDINGELCLYDEQGCPLAGLTSVASTFDPLLGKPGKRVFWLPENTPHDQGIRLWGDAGYNDLFGRLSGNGRLVEACVATCSETMRQVYHDVAFLVDY